MVSKLVRDMENEFLNNMSPDELKELLAVISAQIGTIALQESGMEKLTSNYMLGKTYTECLYQHLLSSDINVVDATSILTYVMFQLGLVDLKIEGQYGFYNPNCYLKYLILDTVTAGEYLRLIIKGVLSYNSVGVVLCVDFEEDVLNGSKAGIQEILVEMVRVGNTCQVKYVTLKNLLSGWHSLEDALTLLTDSLCLLYAPLGLKFLRDSYFANKTNIVYNKNRIIPLRYVLYGNERNSEYYRRINDSLYVANGNEYTQIPRYCSSAHVYDLLRNKNNHYNVITKSVNVQGYCIGVYDGTNVLNASGNLSVRQRLTT